MSEVTGFDFGADVPSAGNNFKNASVGNHAARLRSIIHLGMVADTFEGKPKPPAPFVVAIFEAKEDEDLNEDGTPIRVTKEFALRKGDRAFLTKFMKAALTPEEFTQYEAGVLKGGFDDFIGRGFSIDMKGSKEKNDDGTPKYTNVDGIGALNKKLLAITPELSIKGVGHVPFAKLTKEAVLEIPPYLVRKYLMQSTGYEGSPAQRAVQEILKSDPKAFSAKDSDPKDDAPAKSAPAEVAPPAVDANQEF